MSLNVYVDLDQAKCKVKRKSIIGYSDFLGDNRVSKKSKKQYVLARSSVEVEFRAMCSVNCETMWLLKILDEMKVCVELLVPRDSDNNATI